jgi:hypothetical protein
MNNNIEVWQSKLDDLIKLSYHGVDGPPQSTDFFKLPYTTLMQGLPKPEGEIIDFPSWNNPCNGLIDNFLDGLRKWLAGRELIVWRQRPEIYFDAGDFMHPINGKTEYNRYAIYCRLTAYRRY